jgi:hypothetical protein
MAWSIKTLLDKAEGPADIAGIALGASVGGTVDLIAMLNGVPTLGGAALLGAGYGYGLVQGFKAFFTLRRRPQLAHGHVLEQELMSRRLREQALGLLEFVLGAAADKKRDVLLDEIMNEIHLFDRGLVSNSEFAEILPDLLDRARRLRVTYRQIPGQRPDPRQLNHLSNARRNQSTGDGEEPSERPPKIAPKSDPLPHEDVLRVRAARRLLDSGPPKQVEN